MNSPNLQPGAARRWMLVTALLAAGGVVCAIAGVVLLVAGFSGAVPEGNVLGALKRGGGNAPVDAGFSSGVPRGLYFMTRFWGFTGTLEKAAWYFAPDGRVYRDLERGFSAADLEQHKGQQGSVAVDGETMTVTWSNGKRTSSKLERDGEAFSWDAGIFTPVQEFASDDDLVAEWEGGESLSTGGNHASVSKSLVLREDGTFTWNSVSFLKGESADSVVTAGSEGGTKGKWERDGYSLALTGEDGTTFRGIAFPYDDEKTPVNPDRFFFAGTMYKRR
jgi:hypothetical protein